jgi:hypothetical protein
MKFFRKRINRYIFNVLLFVSASTFILMHPTDATRTADPRFKDEVFPKIINFKPNKKNPDPPNSAQDKDLSFYTIIFDDVYEPKDYHCLMYSQWVDNLRDSEYVDGIEIYSLNGWKHRDCKLSTVTVPPPPTKMYDPTSWQMFKSLELFLERSESKWLFLVGDAAYIKTDKLLAFMLDIMKENKGFVAKGGCIEVRYFFQMLELSSGIIMSRDVVEKMVSLDVHWNVSIRSEMNGEEALGHAMNNVGLFANWLHTHGFVGNEFHNKRDYEILEKGEFSKLSKCYIRDELRNPSPGSGGNCAKDSQSFNGIISWAGGGKYHRKEFLENAEAWMSGVDSNVAVIWERTKPVLCLS